MKKLRKHVIRPRGNDKVGPQGKLIDNYTYYQQKQTS